MRDTRDELRQLAQKLGSLAILAGAAAALFGFQSWLHASGGWPLLTVGLVCLWSAALAAGRAGQRERRGPRVTSARPSHCPARGPIATPTGEPFTAGGAAAR